MNKTKTRTLLIFFCLAVSAVFGYTIVKTEDYKEKKSKYTNINSENNDLAIYRQQLIKQMEEDKKMYQNKMKTAKEQYEDLLSKQDAAIKEHTKTIAVVSKSFAPAESKNIANASSSSSTSSKSSTQSTTKSSSGSTVARPAPARNTQGS